MKRIKLLLSFALVLCLLLSLNMPAFAASTESTETTYTVRVYDGLSNNSYKEYTREFEEELDLGDYSRNTSATTGMYYRKGLHLAGKDNNTTIENLTDFTVTEDTDLVISYGYMGSAVLYRVAYVEAGTGEPLTPEDADGNLLSSVEEFYCSDGDTITVNYRQVVGYQIANTYTFTRTMHKDEPTFTFTFEYVPEVEAAPATPAEGEVVTDQAPNVVLPDGGVPAAPTPAENINLDEDETPLGLLDLGKDAVENGAQLLNALPFGARVGLIGLDLVVIGLIIWGIVYAARRRKEQKEQKESNP